MKKIFLLSVLASISSASFAQSISVGPGRTAVGSEPFGKKSTVAGKTTAVGDTFILGLTTTADTLTQYYVGSTDPLDSGFAFGMNAYGDKGYAQRYNVKASDSTIKVIGTYSLFGGTVNPASTKMVDFMCWSEGPKTVWARPTLFNSGKPNTVLASRSVSIKNLGIGVGSDPDTFLVTLFTTPTAFLTSNYFVGYTLNYTWATAGGDTISVRSTQQGERTAVGYTVNSATDTTINNYNMTMYADGTWHDIAQEKFRAFVKLYIRPIVIIGAPTPGSVGITNNDFTLHGNYPNPATNSTTVSFSLAASADVTVTVADMAGRTLKTIAHSGMKAGEQTLQIETSDLASGDYIYVINTSNGGGIAAKFTVIR